MTTSSHNVNTEPEPGYVEATRSGLYSFLFVLPLFLTYEALAWVLNTGFQVQVRNAADVWLKSTLDALASLWGVQGTATVSLALILALGAILYQRDARYRRDGIRWPYFGGMLAESLLYSILFGGVVSFLTSSLFLAAPLGFGVATTFMVSLGAGLYEELLFRVLLVGGLVHLGALLLPKQTGLAAVTAVLLGAFLFSVVHYLGPLGDPFRLHSFLFRFVAGVVLSGLYVLRGFGITAYTHAFYDIWLLLWG